MAARLGRVFYWLGCAISIFVFVGTMVFVNAVADGKPNASEYVFIAFCTAVPWVIGRALFNPVSHRPDAMLAAVGYQPLKPR